VSKTRAKPKGRGNAKEYRAMVVSLLRERDGDNCGICGHEIPYDEMSVDHIKQVWEGGTGDADNLRLAHLSCNLCRPRGNGIERKRMTRCQSGRHSLLKPGSVYVKANGQHMCARCREEYNENYRKKVKSGA
jgi:hypothetical protein